MNEKNLVEKGLCPDIPVEVEKRKNITVVLFPPGEFPGWTEFLAALASGLAPVPLVLYCLRSLCTAKLSSPWETPCLQPESETHLMSNLSAV